MSEEFDIRNTQTDKDKEFERALRPSAFNAFNGQEKIVENLKVFVKAARMRKESLDHILLLKYHIFFLRHQLIHS